MPQEENVKRTIGYWNTVGTARDRSSVADASKREESQADG